MKKILFIIIGLLLIGGIFVTAKLIKDEIKIKDVKEIDCNKKYDEEKCNEIGKIKIEEDAGIKIDLIQDGENGTELYKVRSK